MSLGLLAAAISAAAPDASEGAEHTLLAAGDIGRCDGTGDQATAAILDAHPDATVATLGDNAYENGTAEEFRNCYGPDWGRHIARTRPSPGNHDYYTPGGSGYFGYFGAAAGDPTKGYYSYDLGEWHLVALNSNCEIVSCAPGSLQERWLRADLEASQKACALAYWHHPLFTSGKHFADANLQYVRPLWQALYEHGADVILVGHDHDYERFAPQTPTGAADSLYGIRQFVVGTGGAPLRPFETVTPNSEVRDYATFGVLRLVLRSGGYDWQFLPQSGKTFTDTGSGSCHGVPDRAPPDSNPTISSSHGSAWSNDPTVEVTWSGASDSGSGVDGFSYSWTTSPDGGEPNYTKDAEETATGTTSLALSSGQWWFHLRTRDNAGNWSVAVHHGPFRIDTVAPVNPEVRSPSHDAGDWSNNPIVEIEWDPGSDALSGVDGYSYRWSQEASTVPDQVEDTGSPDGVLPEGESWFHLRTVDVAGNWSQAAHFGPFKIDTTAPTNPTISSPSHPVGTWSNEPTVVVEWNGAAGLEYSHEWSQSEATVPDEVVEGTEKRATKALVDGSWWFHVHARDASGSWSSTTHLGPFLIDRTAPETHAAFGAAGIEFGASEPAAFLCALDAAAFAACAAPVRYENLASGDHVFRVFARDRAGNDDASPAELRWTVQQPQPQPTRPPAAVKRCVVPRLAGLTLRRTRTLLARRGCRLGRVAYAYSRLRKGLVLTQRPRAGRRLALGARVSVRVSRGALPRRR